jgi:hypothetical protein
LRFAFDTAAPAFYQEDDATGGMSAAKKFSVHAQNRIGTGATVGAELELSSGTGATAGPLTLKVGSTAMLQAADLGSRTVLGLFGAVTTTQMPTGTGDKVLFIANATGASTITESPVGGGILYVDSIYGLSWKGKGAVETTIAQYSGLATTKRRVIDWKSDPITTTPVSTATFNACQFAVTGFNRRGLTNGTITVRGKCIIFGSDLYPGYCEHIATFRVDAGVVTQVGISPGFGANGIMGSGATAATIDFSGTSIRYRITPFWPTNTFMAYFEVHAAED